ncbi:MAG: helix-turn-helix domain-containing protein [Candidatus Limnocylindria bacterium]
MAGSRNAVRLGLRIGPELRLARTAAGMTQMHVAERSGLAQTVVSRIERGWHGCSIESLARFSAAVGHDLGFRLFPLHGVSLRDSGQLGVALAIRGRLHASWTVSLEAPVAPAPDRRAADMFLTTHTVAVHVEIERAIVDLQAQLRSAQLKRDALRARSPRPVRLVLAIPERRQARRVVRENWPAVSLALPVRSAAIWRALLSGVDPRGDGLLWVKPGAPTAR